MRDVPPLRSSSSGMRKTVTAPEYQVVCHSLPDQVIIEPSSPICEYEDLSALLSAILKESPLLAFLMDLRHDLVEFRGRREQVANVALYESYPAAHTEHPVQDGRHIAVVDGRLVVLDDGAVDHDNRVRLGDDRVHLGDDRVRLGNDRVHLGGDGVHEGGGLQTELLNRRKRER